MKRFSYLLALGALLTLGTGCEKEPATDNQPTQVPLYVNTWTITQGDASTDKGPQTIIYEIGADKTFNLGYVATESFIDELKLKYLPSTDADAPTIDGDTPATDDDEEAEEQKKIIEKINSLQVGDVIIVFRGMYVETLGEKDGAYLSLFILFEISDTGLEMAESMRNELHIIDVTENTLTIKNEESSQPAMTMQSLETSGLTVGKVVDCSDFLGDF